MILILKILIFYKKKNRTNQYIYSTVERSLQLLLDCLTARESSFLKNLTKINTKFRICLFLKKKK